LSESSPQPSTSSRRDTCGATSAAVQRTRVPSTASSVKGCPLTDASSVAEERAVRPDWMAGVM